FHRAPHREERIRLERVRCYVLTDRFDRMMALSVGAAVLACVLGVYASFHLDASTGGCIVSVQALLFFAAMWLAPKRGLMARARLRRAALQPKQAAVAPPAQP
ncbi:MAG TPA: metal ABC transporter permease, partial [Herpetosiphonaceae bacterium]|nr:metal ABC transporter permease [Herpetosiphonaceae bacterium]